MLHKRTGHVHAARSRRPSDAELEEPLGYRLLDNRLLQAALTHPSHAEGLRDQDRVRETVTQLPSREGQR